MGLVRQRRKILDKLEKDVALLQKAAMKDDKVSPWGTCALT